MEAQTRGPEPKKPHPLGHHSLSFPTSSPVTTQVAEHLTALMHVLEDLFALLATVWQDLLPPARIELHCHAIPDKEETFSGKGKIK